MRKKKKGFTLVELSIVLVIIGLLIGGILVGQSLIESAKVQAQIRQIGQLDAGIATFKDKFRGLPGDSSLINGIGNNDGVISCAADPDSSTAIYTLEVKYVWSDLQASGMFKGYVFGTVDNCNFDPCSFTPPNLDAIPAKINDKAGILVAMDYNFHATNFNAYTFSSFDTGDIEDSTPSVACIDAFAIDKKIDNVLTNSGNVWSPNCDSGSQAYRTDASDLSPVLIKILSQTGG